MGRKKYDRKDALYMKAKEEGLASRAAYKLKELDARFSLLRPGYAVLDLGAWPGGWMQIAAPVVGRSGKVVGIDFKAIEQQLPENCASLVGDVGDAEVLKQAADLAGRKFDLVLSDMAPHLTGIKDLDRAQSLECAELSASAAKLSLKKNGNFVTKVFKSNEADGFFKELRPFFKKCVRAELDATRASSNEYYIVGLDFVGEA